METISAALRRYISLFEDQTAEIAVSVARYVGIDQIPSDGSPFPAYFVLQVDQRLNRDAITHWVKSELQTVTGYEPAKFHPSQ